MFELPAFVWGTLLGMMLATFILLGAYIQRHKMYWKVRKRLENCRAWNDKLRKELGERQDA